MTDCPNAEIRDLLPDLVHGRLDAAARADVERHEFRRWGSQSCKYSLMTRIAL